MTDSDTVQKRGDQLAVGDTVHTVDGIRTVTYTQPADCGRVLVVFDDDGASITRWSAGNMWTLATEAEIAAAKAEANREGMARALEYLADLVRRHRVAPTLYSIDVRASVSTIADLQTWATALDRPITPGGTDKTIPVVRADDVARFGGVRLDVSAQANRETLPTAAPESEGEVSPR